MQGRKAIAPSQQRKALAAKRRRGAAPKVNGAQTRQGVHTAAGVLARAELGARAGSRWALLDTAAAEEQNREILLRKKVPCYIALTTCLLTQCHCRDCMITGRTTSSDRGFFAAHVLIRACIKPCTA